VWVAALAGCSDEPSAEEQRRQLADDLVAEVGEDLGRAEAECVAEAMQAEFGDDSFQRVIDAAAGDAAGTGSDEGDEAVRSTIIDIFAACDALEAVTTTSG
jgi:hypothetical protein